MAASDWEVGMHFLRLQLRGFAVILEKSQNSEINYKWLFWETKYLMSFSEKNLI